FREEDAPFFFGREAFTEQLLQVVPNRSLTALVGPSGSGKSSVVYAGLLPKLRTKGSWLVLPFRPGERPLLSLARVLVPYLEPNMSEVDRLAEINKLAERLWRSEINLPQIITRLRETNSASNFLVLVDQFEELYTLCQDGWERQRFLEEIIAVVGRPNPQPGS